MQASRIIAVAALGVISGAAPADADVTISNAATANMICSGGICAPIASDAVLNAGDLESMLAAGAVKVMTAGAGVQATNIRLESKLTWRSANLLALDAYKSITVDKPMQAKGMGGVSVTTDDGGAGGEFSFGINGHLTFANLTSPLLINGTSYMLVSSVSSLADAIAANPSENYALANNYDASGDDTYAAAPIATTFTGNFDGLGNTISNLMIYDPTTNAYVGLFAETSGNATLSNLQLANLNVTGGSGTYPTSEYVGGLVGYADGGAIEHVIGTGSVTAGESAVVGGLIGVGVGRIEFCGADILVSNEGLGDAGGLAGAAEGPLEHSHAKGNVSGSGFVGGLVGTNIVDSVTHSSASGAVISTDNETYAGGLTGMNFSGTVEDSSASGAVTCRFSCGGLVGIEGWDGGAYPRILRSYASGNVTSAGGAGGLVGLNQLGRISDSYAIGAVSATMAGGLLGENADTGNIVRSYSSGLVAGSTGTTGGLIGYDGFFSIRKHTYWDMTTSGITNKSQVAGNVPNDPGIKGLSNKKLQSGLPKGFNPRVWGENSTLNGGLPYLLANRPAK